MIDISNFELKKSKRIKTIKMINELPEEIELKFILNQTSDIVINAKKKVKK